MDDSSDKTIRFDEKGYCNYCNSAEKYMKKFYFPNWDDDSALKMVIKSLKEEGKKYKYDCMMGISGGLDSSYVAYLGAMKWGLRIFAVHIDDGYDTEISKRNIARLANMPNVDLITITPDAKQYNELTRAFMLAGVPNIAIPQDNILFAELYKAARKYKIHAFLGGGNFSLEAIIQRGNTHDNTDVTNIKDIFKRFGRGKINKLNFMSQFEKDVIVHLLGLKLYRVLDLINYNREKAIKEMNEEIGFEYYGSKHLENDLTKFIQLYWFPKKFNVDKRKSHYSSMIMSKQLSRSEALELMKKPMYNEADMQKTIDMVLERLDLTHDQFDEIMKAPTHQHDEYKVSMYPKIRSWIKNNFHIKTP